MRLDIGSGPNLHKTIITSAVLHLLFIAIVALPPGTKEREENRYFVNLVSQAEILKIRETALPDKPDRKPEKSVTAEIKKTELHKAMPEENKNIMSPHANQKSLPPEPLQKTGGEKIAPQERDEITGDVQKYRRPAFEGNEQFQKQQYMITRENRAAQTGPVRIEKGRREPATAPGEGLQKQQYVIARADRPAGSNPGPLDKGYRGQAFEGKEQFQEQQFTIAGKDKPSRTESVTKSLKSDADGNSGFGLKRNVEIGYSGQTKDAGAIEKPGLPAKSGEGGIVNKRRDEQASEEAALKRDIEKYGNDKSPASDFSIQGVPLNDLLACPNALDERALKKKILKIIGDNKLCNNPAKGKFVFLGTGRITSFDMIIMPVSGRKLSNRCDELENAYTCLNSAKE